VCKPVMVQRRDFLRLVGAGAAMAALGSGCSSRETVDAVPTAGGAGLLAGLSLKVRRDPG
jgi:hypothetical protein